MYGWALLATLPASVLLQGFTLWPLTGLVTILAALSAAGLIARHGTLEPLAIDASGALLLAFSLWLLAAAQLSPLPAQASTGLYQQLVLTLACLATTLDRENAATWRRLRVLGAALCALLALSLLAEPLYAERPTFSAFFVQRNSLSGYVMLLVFMLVPALASARRPLPWAVAIYLGFLIIFFSTSRAALGAVIVGYVGLVLTAGSAFRRNPGQLVLALALWAFLGANLLRQGEVLEAVGSLRVVSQQLVEQGGALASGYSGGLYVDGLYVGGSPELIALSPIAASKVASANERFLIWRGTWTMLADAPWHGYGPGTFHLVYPGYSLNDDHSARAYAHNDMLQIAAELGWPGLVIFLALALSLSWRWATWRRRARPTAAERMEVDCLFWGVAALAAHSLFDYNFYVPATLVLVGCVLARVLALTRAERPGRGLVLARHFGPRSFRFVVLALAAVPALALASASLMSREYAAAIDALGRGELGLAQRALDRAARYSPHERIEVARAHLFLAAFEASRVATQQAEFFALAQTHLERAARMNPYMPEVPFTRMLLAAHAPELAPAARTRAMQAAYAETLRRDRRYYPVRLELARYLAARQQTGPALALLEGGLAQPFAAHPQVLDYLELLRELRAAAGDLAGARAAERELARVRARWGGAA